MCRVKQRRYRPKEISLRVKREIRYSRRKDSTRSLRHEKKKKKKEKKKKIEERISFVVRSRANFQLITETNFYYSKKKKNFKILSCHRVIKIISVSVFLKKKKEKTVPVFGKLKPMSHEGIRIVGISGVRPILNCV